MKKSLLALPIILGIIVLISIPSVMAQSESEIIPNWIKGVANFWIEGGIDDADFIAALEFLIDVNVIKLGDNVVVNNTMSVITAEQKNILDLTISQKEDRIKILESEVNVLNNKISSMPVIPSESAMLVNLNERNETLQNLNDQLEQEKDDLEEEFMKKESETQVYYEKEMETFRKGWSDVSQKYDILKMKYDVLKESGIDLDKLNELMSEKDKKISDLEAELDALK